MLKLISWVITALRFLLAVAAAAALLYTFSYPNSIIPPNPAAADIEGISIYSIKPVLWLLPLALLESICLTGPHRNRVWFGSMLTVTISGLLAWPILLAWRPELVHPMLPFEDAKLATGLGYMALLLAASVLLRLVVLAHLFPRPTEWQSTGDIDASVLDPATARTVREIAADTRKVQPHFLFGAADQGVIDRFRELMSTLWRRNLRHRCLLGAALLAGLLWFFLYPQPSETETMERDFAVMYETQPKRRPKHTALVDYKATPRAVHAAWRIMKHVHDHESLAGMTLAEAETWMRLDGAPERYRHQLRADHTQLITSVEPAFDSRTPFITVTDGRHTAALYIRTDATGERINVAEVVDAGWNAVADEHRRLFGNDWKMNY